MVTPQKRPKVMRIGGLRRFAMNALGVRAAIVCPRVMAKNYRQRLFEEREIPHQLG